MTNISTSLVNVKFNGFLDETLSFLSVRGHLISNFAHVMAFYGTSLGHYAHIEWGSGIYANMNWVIVGKTGCGKGTSLNFVKELFSFDHRSEDLLPPVRHVCFTSGKTAVGFIYDTLGDYEEEENRFLAITEEFVCTLRSLRISTNKLDGYLLNLSDGAEINESYKKGRIRLVDLHYGSIGHITPPLFAKNMKGHVLDGGFASRLCPVLVPDPEYRFGPGTYDKKEFTTIQSRLRSSLQKSSERFVIEMEDDAVERFHAFDKYNFDRCASNEGSETIITRFPTTCLRIAMTISLINEEEKISLASMESACAVMEYSRATIEHLVDGQSTPSAVKQIRDFIQRKGSATRTEITQEFFHSLKREEIEKALGDLIDQNIIYATVSTGARGRRTTTYAPVAETTTPVAA